LPAPSESPYLSARQVAERFNVEIQTVRNWIKTGRLAAIRLNSRDYRVHRDELARFEARAQRGGEISDAAVEAILNEAFVAGRLPRRPTPETYGAIAKLLRQHYRDQAELAAGRTA